MAYSRARSRTMAVTKRSALKKGLTKVERHTILLQTVKQLDHDMDVFHLRWMPGEYLDQDMVQSVPIFWFKKFGWSPVELAKLYTAGQIKMTAKTKAEITHVYGKRRKTKVRRKDSGKINGASLLKQNSTTGRASVNTDDIYRRTRRLLKKVKAVPTKVRVVDNRSEMNIQNAGFPDLGLVSGQEFEQFANEVAKADTETKETEPEIIAKTPVLCLDSQISISETEEESFAATGRLSLSLNAASSTNRPTHKSTNSISTPFGEMDANATLNLRQKHRRTSSLLQRVHNMMHYGEIVWNKLAILSERGDTLSQRQFDIELQNNSVLADPDICKELFKTIQAKDPVDKKRINKDDIDRVCAELDKIPLVDEIAADTIKDEEHKIWIVLKQVFVKIAQSESFDVASFLTVKLSADDLNNVDLLLEYISSRHKDWMTRLQIMKWITANFETSDNFRSLTSDDNIGPFLLGWMCQCLDERSNLAKAALEMFPNILSITMTQTGEAFQYLNDIFSSLFLVVRNKRSKDLNETANECIIQCVDMIMDWHEHGELDNEVLLELCHIFRDNTIAKEQKHDKVRERCVAYFGYIIFGVQGQNNEMDISTNNENTDNNEQDPTSPLSPEVNGLKVPNTVHKAFHSANDVTEMEEKWEPSAQPSFVGHKHALKISKTMKRIYLLEDDHQQFREYMNDAMNNGITDKSADTRNTTFKLLEKLEKVEYEANIVEEVLRIDALALSKYKKWKQRKDKSKQKKSSKKKKKARIRNPKHAKKKSVTLTIGAQTAHD